ncbi:MAG: hypothetical protein KDC04_08810, partial [Saprospiraceae bacterium]|nr:hypothetical protein [Saprospiraceae bacterium]
MKLTSNLSQSGLFVILFNLLIISHLFGQSTSVCPVNVGKEPMSSSQDQSVGLVSQSYSINASTWQNIDKGRRSDDAYMEVHLGEFKRSMVLEGKNFNFQIPPHSIVSGIMLQVEGKSSNPSDLKEIEISLTGPDGVISNNNYANTAKNQGAWSTLSNGTDSQWMYGSSTDTWGSDWKGTDVNSSEFGFRLHLRNSNTDSIDVYIDKINLTVFYTPLYNFCEDNCLTFYIDRYETFGSYIWKVPQGFRMVSHTTKNQTIDLKVNPDTPYGQYEICVDVFDYSNNYVETCCRPFVYEDCTSSFISGVAWQDFNNNAVNDLTDGTLSNVEVSLFTASGSLISTVKTDSSGHYQFSDIL